MYLDIDQIVRTAFPGTGENVTVEELRQEVQQALHLIELGQFEEITL